MIFANQHWVVHNGNFFGLSMTLDLDLKSEIPFSKDQRSLFVEMRKINQLANFNHVLPPLVLCLITRLKRLVTVANSHQS